LRYCEQAVSSLAAEGVEGENKSWSRVGRPLQRRGPAAANTPSQLAIVLQIRWCEVVERLIDQDNELKFRSLSSW